MKKLLMALSVLGITASSAATVVSCGNTDKDSVTDQVATTIGNQLGGATTNRWTLSVANDKQTQENIKEEIIKQSPALMKYKNKLKVTVTNFEKASKQGDQGTITLEVLNKEENIKNPQDNTNQFKFSFLTQDVVDDMTTTIPQVTSALTAEPTLNLSNINVDLSGTGVPLLNDIKTVGALINLVVTTGANLIPAKVPTNFTDDTNWTGFQALLNLVKSIIGDNDTISETITPMDGTTLNVNFKITDVLKNILPDLVHLKNFVTQENQNGNKNLILNLMNYFFAEPSDINGDGFAEIDQDIKDVNDDTKTITLEDNLQRLVYHLLEGWKTVDGTSLPDGVKPIHIDFNGQPIRYQQNIKDEDNVIIGIFDLIPEESIPNFIDLLLGTSYVDNNNGTTDDKWNGGYDLQNPLSFTFSLEGVIFDLTDPLPITVPTSALAGAIKGSLKNLLANSNPVLATKLDYLNLDWTKGMMTVEYQTKADQTWKQAKTLDDLGEATNLRVKFINNTWEVRNKLNDEVTTITGKSFTINLDLTTNLTFPTPDPAKN